MSQDSRLHAGSRAKVMRIIWLVASLLVLFTAENLRARTWVDVADGRIVRQEANMMGETVVLQRE